MSDTSYHTYESAAIPTRTLTHVTPSGREFSYTVTKLTDFCFLLEANHTHCVRQFASVAALNTFWQALKVHLSYKYSQKLLPAPAALPALPAPQIAGYLPAVTATAAADQPILITPVPASVQAILSATAAKLGNRCTPSNVGRTGQERTLTQESGRTNQYYTPAERDQQWRAQYDALLSAQAGKSRPDDLRPTPMWSRVPSAQRPAEVR